MTASVLGSGAITWPIPFPNAFYAATASDAGSTDYTYAVASATVTGATLYAKIGDTSDPSLTATGKIIAIGC